MKCLRKLAGMLLLLSVVSLPLFSENTYLITESELVELEQTLTEQETNLQKALETQKTLLMETERLKTYCQELESEARLNKTLAGIGVSVGIAGIITGGLIWLVK